MLFNLYPSRIYNTACSNNKAQYEAEARMRREVTKHPECLPAIYEITDMERAAPYSTNVVLLHIIYSIKIASLMIKGRKRLIQARRYKVLSTHYPLADIQHTKGNKDTHYNIYASTCM